MKYAIISDIHSNLEALTKALEIINQRSVNEIICLGDIVGYGANPNECIGLVRQHCTLVIKGNHDEAILNPSITQHFTEDARAAIMWTLKNISEENVSYLQTLSLSLKIDNLLFVHASPCKPERWNYILEEITAAQAFHCFSESLCFIGHTHTPATFSTGGRVLGITKGERFIINVGSIGQPRDRIADLSFGIFDSDVWSYDHIRSSYQVETAMQKILDTDLPPRLGHRLLVGV